MDRRTISVCFIRAMLERFAVPGVSVDELLTGAGIPPTALQSDKARVTPAQFSRLSRMAIQLTEDESVGHYPRPFQLGTFRTLARYMSGADDLRGAVRRNIEFLNLFETGYSLELIEFDKSARYRTTPTPGSSSSPWVYEQHQMITHRFLSWLVGMPIPLTAVNCHYPPPPHRDEYHYLFFCPTHFEQDCCELIFERRVLDLPLLKSSDEVETLVRKMPYNLLFMPTRQKGYSDQIRRYIRKSLPNQPSYEQIASSLGLTPQTLRRRLREEGCDYRRIRNELLRDTAIEMLQQPEQSVQEISYRLGFSEPSAFIRSFRNWTGMPPNHYRRQQVAVL